MPIATDWGSLTREKTPKKLYQKLSHSLTNSTDDKLSEPAQLRRLSSLNSKFLGASIVGALSIFYAVFIHNPQIDSTRAILLLLLGFAFVGLGIISLLGLISTWLEESATQRLMLLKLKFELECSDRKSVIAKDALTIVQAISEQFAPLLGPQAFSAAVAELVLYELDERPHKDVAAKQQKLLNLLKDGTLSKLDPELSADLAKRAHSISAAVERSGYDA